MRVGELEFIVYCSEGVGVLREVLILKNLNFKSE